MKSKSLELKKSYDKVYRGVDPYREQEYLKRKAKARKVHEYIEQSRGKNFFYYILDYDNYTQQLYDSLFSEKLWSSEKSREMKLYVEGLEQK